MTPSVDIAASWLVIAGTTAGGWWLARVNRYAKKLGATMAIIVLGLLIANLSNWKPEAEVSGWVNGPLTSLAIVELLLAVELRRVLPDARRLLPLSCVCPGHRVSGARLWMVACPLAWGRCLSFGGFVHGHVYGRNFELCVRGSKPRDP